MFNLTCTPEQFEYIIQHLKDNGMVVEPSHPSNEVTFNGHSVIGSASFDPTDDELVITITHKPFFISEDKIENGIKDAIKSMPTAATETASVKDNN